MESPLASLSVKLHADNCKWRTPHVGVKDILTYKKGKDKNEGMCVSINLPVLLMICCL